MLLCGDSAYHIGSIKGMRCFLAFLLSRVADVGSMLMCHGKILNKIIMGKDACFAVFAQFLYPMLDLSSNSPRYCITL